MKELFFALERRTTAFALWCAVFMLVVAAIIGFYQILARFVLLRPAEWSEVSVRFTLIWMVFLGCPVAFRHGAMVCVDLAYRKSGPGLRRALDLLVAVSSLALMGLILWLGLDYTWRGRFQTIAGFESLTMSYAYAALPVGGAFSVLAIVAQWFDPGRHDLDTAQ